MRSISILLLAAIVLMALGCSSGGNSPVIPDMELEKPAASDVVHNIWGLWQFTADPDAGTLDIVPVRGADMHLNALQFLEPPVLLNLTLDSLEFNGNMIEADIGLRHPFLGMTEFSGFDVAGILISSGSVSGFDDPDIVMAGDGDTRLLNYDGLTRWWNPVEFPHDGTMFSYKNGLLGTPDSSANFNATLNGFKYYCDDLSGANDPLTNVDPEGRALFLAGQKNVRHFTIDTSGGLVFNYAVDASWQFPAGAPPWNAPDDFPNGANKPEAWMLSISTLENTLWNDGVGNGGDLTLDVDVYDWFNGDQNTIKVESSGNFAVTEVTGTSGSGTGYFSYEVAITDATPQNSGTIELFITATCEVTGFGGVLPGKPQSAYAFYSVDVADEEPTFTPGEWTTFQHDAQHSGLSEVNGPQTNNVAWTNSFMLGNAVSVLCGPGDPLYAVFFGSIYANRPLYAVDRNSSGALLWSQDFGGPNSSFVKVLVVEPSDGSVYAYYSQNGTMHKLDPADGTDMVTPLSGFAIGADDFAVLHDNGNIYVMTNNGSIACADPDLTSKTWQTSIGFAGNGSPCIGIDGEIIAYGGNSIVSLDPDNGGINWNAPVSSTQSTPTVMSDGTIIIGTASGTIYAVNPDGSSKWNVSPIAGYRCAISSGAEGPNGDFYITMDSGNPLWQEQLIRLDPDDGSTINTSGTAYDMKSSSIPAIGADGKIYINGSQRIFAFNPDCTLLWQSSIVGGIYGGQSLGPCAIDVNGDLYAASGTHGFICISDG